MVHGPCLASTPNIEIVNLPHVENTATMPPTRERLLELAKVTYRLGYMSCLCLHELQVSCRIFSTTFNPNNIRTGNKILRQRLKGPTFLEYYPRRVVTFKDLKRSFPMLQFRDVDEEQRVRDVAAYGTLPLYSGQIRT